MKYFVGKDFDLINSLKYNSSLKPSFDLVKSCLVWTDERPDGLTPDGYEKLCDLWIVRSFIHQDLPRSQWGLDPLYFSKSWDLALGQGFMWPGFERLKLNEDEETYFMDCLNQMF